MARTGEASLAGGDRKPYLLNVSGCPAIWSEGKNRGANVYVGGAAPSAGGSAPKEDKSMLLPVSGDARVSVVRHLQAIADEVPPGTETSEIADHAIDLALSPTRDDPSPALLFRNVWRNARFIVRRRREVVLDPITADSPVGRLLEDGALSAVSKPETPEDLIIAKDLAERIRGAADCVDRHGAECFDGLLAGESLEETAQRLHITPRSVRHIRAQIRAFARCLIHEKRAA